MCLFFFVEVNRELGGTVVGAVRFRERRVLISLTLFPAQEKGGGEEGREYYPGFFFFFFF